MQTFIDKDNNEIVKDITSKEFARRAAAITAHVEFDKKMRHFKMRRRI
jgi:hypothetical protein